MPRCSVDLEPRLTLIGLPLVVARVYTAFLSIIEPCFRHTEVIGAFVLRLKLSLSGSRLSLCHVWQELRAVLEGRHVSVEGRLDGLLLLNEPLH